MPLHSAAEAWLTTLAKRHRGSRIVVIARLDEEPWTISLQQSERSAGLGSPVANGDRTHPVTLAELRRNKATAQAA